MQEISIFWFRRDLRLDDNAGLFHALQSGSPVLPVFIFDKNILEKLEDKADRRVEFIYNALKKLSGSIIGSGSSLNVFHSKPLDAFIQLAGSYNIKAVYANHDYEPYARERDEEIRLFLKDKGIPFITYKDQVIFEKDEVLKDDGKPYTVFTPYSKKWKSALTENCYKSYPCEKYCSNFLKQDNGSIPGLEYYGFVKSKAVDFTPEINFDIIPSYNKTRDYPAQNGTTKAGVHIRFGTISIRQLVQKAIVLNDTYLNELIWREFYQMILWHFPETNKAFKREYDLIEWRNNEKDFEAWCSGKTGYPIVDAGMRELNKTGYIHNRVRMIVASFLTKHLLIDWRWGEAYFAQKLLDFDLAANNGGWQWASGSGCDAAPYFRIFNPYIQTKKFDPELTYIKKWVPEFQEFDYPEPIVNHEFARKRCLEVYKKALNSKK